MKFLQVLLDIAVWFWTAPIAAIYVLLFGRFRHLHYLLEALLWQGCSYLAYVVYGQLMSIIRVRNLFEFLGRYHQYQFEKEALASNDLLVNAIEAAGRLDAQTRGILQPRFHYVRLLRPKDGVKAPRLDKLLCFRAFQPLPSYVFARGQISKLDALRRFFIIHELGHISVDNTSALYSQMSINTGFYVYCFWAVCNGFVWGRSYITLVALCLVPILGIVRASRRGDTWRLSDEMNADAFALSHFTRSEWAQLRDDLQTCPELMYDTSLSIKQNSKRRKILVDSLGRGQPAVLRPLSVFPKEFLLAMIAIVWATIMRLPSQESGIYALPIICLLTLSVVFLFASVAANLGDQHVAEFLDGQISWEQACVLHAVNINSQIGKLSRLILGLNKRRLS